MTCAVHVVDDVLTYIWCHHVERSLPRDTICHLLDNWTPMPTEKLKAAGVKLLEIIPTELRKSLKLQQRRAGEKQRHLLVSDIVDIFNSDAFVSLEKKPTFVCKDVTCLPPASPKEADLAFLLKKMGEMQDRLAVTEAGQRDIADRVAIVEASCLPANPATGLSCADKVAASAQKNPDAPTLPAATSPDLSRTTDYRSSSTIGCVRTTSVIKAGGVRVSTGTGSSAAVGLGKYTNHERDDGFTTVGPRGRPLRQAPQPRVAGGRRPRRDAIRGTGNAGNLTAAPIPDARLFLTGLGTDVTTEMVRAHVTEATGGTISLTDCVAVGKSTRVASFCITVAGRPSGAGDMAGTLLHPEILPSEACELGPD